MAIGTYYTLYTTMVIISQQVSIERKLHFTVFFPMDERPKNVESPFRKFTEGLKKRPP